jgi:hypothetical protein
MGYIVVFIIVYLLVLFIRPVTGCLKFLAIYSIMLWAVQHPSELSHAFLQARDALVETLKHVHIDTDTNHAQTQTHDN